MNLNTTRLVCLATLLLSVCACSGGAELDANAEENAVDALEDSNDEYPAPQPATPEALQQIRANMFGGFQRAAQMEISAVERHAIIDLLAEQGVDEREVSFSGANVFVNDVSFSAEPILEQLRARTVEKGKVLSQTITSLIGTHDTDLVFPATIVGAPVTYARQASNAEFRFNRPEVDTTFPHVIVLADNVPARIFQAFRDSIAEIGNAAGDDCLSPTFLRVISRSDFDSEFADEPFDTQPRVTEVVYSPAICGSNALGCTQFPRLENVVLSPPSPIGGGGITQNRFLFGGYIGIDSNQVTPASAEFSTITHELMHLIGIAHPQADEFRTGGAVAKLVVLGTEADDDGFDSIMALRGTGDRVFTLSADDTDTIRTLYNAALNCSYQTVAIQIVPL
jgi:hypothetical protein